MAFGNRRQADEDEGYEDDETEYDPQQLAGQLGVLNTHLLTVATASYHAGETLETIIEDVHDPVFGGEVEGADLEHELETIGRAARNAQRIIRERVAKLAEDNT